MMRKTLVALVVVLLCSCGVEAAEKIVIHGLYLGMSYDGALNAFHALEKTHQDYKVGTIPVDENDNALIVIHGKTKNDISSFVVVGYFNKDELVNLLFFPEYFGIGIKEEFEYPRDMITIADTCKLLFKIPLELRNGRFVHITENGDSAQVSEDGLFGLASKKEVERWSK